MNIFKKKSDETKAVEGVWFPMVDADGDPTDCELLIAKEGNKSFKRCYQRKLDTYLKANRFATRKGVKLEIATKLQMEATAETILVGWKGLKGFDESGENEIDLPYNTANSITLLEEFPWLAEQVNVHCGDEAAFAQEKKEAIIENLNKPSNSAKDTRKSK